MTPDQLGRLRRALGQAIEALIAARDAIEPDPDREPEEDRCEAEDRATSLPAW